MSEAATTTQPARAAGATQRQLHAVNGADHHHATNPRVRAGAPKPAETFEEKLARNRLEAACAHAFAEGKRAGRTLAERDLRSARTESWWFGAIFGFAGGLFLAAAVMKPFQ